MNIAGAIEEFETIFIDTAPIIYYIEAHPQYGALAKIIVESFQLGETKAFTSVLTLTEVMTKPIEKGNNKLADKFVDFLQYGKNLTLLEITQTIAIRAAKLRGKYPSLKTIDALQIATAEDVSADAFLTNDKKLKHIKDIKVLLLTDYL